MIRETSLSRQLAKALETTVKCIPEVQKAVSEGSLDLICVTLTGEKFRRNASEYVKQIDAAETNASYLTLETGMNPSQLALALEVLRSVETDIDLSDFTTGCLIQFLDSEDREVRKEAALTCAKLIFFTNKPAVEVLPRYSRSSTVTVAPITKDFETDAADVVEKLLIVGTADTSPSIRYTVISSLDERFDSYLEQPDNLKSLFFAVNDESFEVILSFICFFNVF